VKPTVYIETSVISYLTARPSRDVVIAGNQAVTHEWWEKHRQRYALFVSPIVLDEIGRGDPDAASKRLSFVRSMRVLDVTNDAAALAVRLIHAAALPAKAQDDAMHIALATVHGMNYLLTWNCAHINNAEQRPRIRKICSAFGYECPEICTPNELAGGNDDER
jgi:predicted nucleic acid-binding protein